MGIIQISGPNFRGTHGSPRTPPSKGTKVLIKYFVLRQRRAPKVHLATLIGAEGDSALEGGVQGERSSP
jgi:hypothetical protein